MLLSIQSSKCSWTLCCIMLRRKIALNGTEFDSLFDKRCPSVTQKLENELSLYKHRHYSCVYEASAVSPRFQARREHDRNAQTH